MKREGVFCTKSSNSEEIDRIREAITRRCGENLIILKCSGHMERMDKGNLAKRVLRAEVGKFFLDPV